MAIFGEFLKKERNKTGLNQSDFGLHFGIIMTDLSKVLYLTLNTEEHLVVAA